MDDLTKEELREKIGLKDYMLLLPSIRRAEEQETLVFHVTDNRNILKNRYFIKKKIRNLRVMKPEQWQKYVYKRLDKKGKEEVKEKIKKQLQPEQNKK